MNPILESACDKLNLLKVFPSCLLVYQIKKWFSIKITSAMCPNRLFCNNSILVRNHNRLLPTGTSRGLREELGLTTLIHRDKPIDSLLNRLSDGEQPVVLQECRLVLPHTTGNPVAFLGGEDDPVEGFVQDVVVVEGTGILGDDVELAAEGTKGASVDGVAVAGGQHVRSGLVDGGVDHKGGRVEEPVLAALEDLAFFAYPDQVGCFD